MARWLSRTVPHWLLQRPIAHRGLHDGQRPENSLPAFEAAIDAGYPIELDVHRIADGSLAVIHDLDLTRMTGESGRIDESSRRTLASRRLAGTDAAIPTFDETLDLIGGRVPVLVDVKSPGRPGWVEAAVLECLDRYRGEIAVQSFNPLTVGWFRRRRPNLTRGLLASDFGDVELANYKKFVLRRLLLAPVCVPDFIGYDLRCLPYWAPRLARRLGVPLLAWTVTGPHECAAAVDVADNFIFEGVRPALRR